METYNTKEMCNKTVADILAEMRAIAEAAEEWNGVVLASTVARLADELEAAAKRDKDDALAAGRLVAALRKPAGNATALREALAMLIDACDLFHQFIENGLDGHYEAIPHYANAADDFLRRVKTSKSALAAPPRNCDVGTSEEQSERQLRFCLSHPRCGGCPCSGHVKYNKCEFAWAQLPYEFKEGCEK